MTVVPLDRRFIVWTNKETGDPEVISYLLAFGVLEMQPARADEDTEPRAHAHLFPFGVRGLPR